ncbi:glycerate kinase [Sulfobacillus harzensis]|uniref:Glycerate kinase n=1 Tax=Sulfobacillus harzensis TaxID=2729629 RepID=A0A7Y0L7I4_9FIRM|nr:glycerate kinase [Sulfobacillus harzensis]NMP24176.1 glycerate kinase [Sulfobacillus harzensis]
MSRVVVALDAFKGALDQAKACQAVAEGLQTEWPALAVDICPLADGGEGTGAVFVAEGAKARVTTVVDAYGRPREARWYQWGSIALIEASEGSPYLPQHRRPGHPRSSTSFGTGALIRTALETKEVSEVWVALGGTGSVDGGIGLLAALGARFEDVQHRMLEPKVDNWDTIQQASLPRLAKPVTALVDVLVPLLGPSGALEGFGPQKGLSLSEARAWTPSLRHFAQAVDSQALETPGAGAAGGMGFALAALGARIASGAEFVAEKVGLRERLRAADWVVTGEGRMDEQSLMGKVVAVVLAEAKRARIPAIAVAGQIPWDLSRFYESGLAWAEPITTQPIALEEAIAQTGDALRAAGARVARIMQMIAEGEKGHVQG